MLDFSTQDHDVYKKRLQADGTPIDEGTKHTIGPENLDLMSKDNVDENGTVCGSCYGAQTTAQPCCNTCDEVTPLGIDKLRDAVIVPEQTNRAKGGTADNLQTVDTTQ